MEGETQQLPRLLRGYSQVVPGRELDTMEVSNPAHVAGFLLEAVRRASQQPWWLVVPVCAVAVRATAGAALLRRHAVRRERVVGPLAPRLAESSRMAGLALRGAKSGAARMRVLAAWTRHRAMVMKSCKEGHFSRNRYLYAFAGLSGLHALGLRYAMAVDPSFMVEGALWFPSLSAYDERMRLPLIAAALSIVALGRPEKLRGAPLTQRVGYAAAAIGAGIVMPVAAWAVEMPNGLALHFAALAAYRVVVSWIGGARDQRMFSGPPVEDSVAGIKKERKKTPPEENPIWKRQ